MRKLTLMRLASAGIVVLGLTAAYPPAPRTAARAMTFDEICSSFAPGCYGGSATLLVGRNMTNVITIRGNFIDHAAASDVTTSSANASVSIRRGYPCTFNGYQTGCLELNLKVESTAAVNEQIPINIAGPAGGKVNTSVRRRGLITGYSQTPATAAWTQPVDIVITGSDIGNATVRMNNHSISNLQSTDSRLSFRAQATGGTPTTAVGFSVRDAQFTTPDYKPNQQVTYAKYTLTPCTSVPGISAPNLQAPANGAVRTFTSPTIPATDYVNFAWQSVNDPQRRYLFELGMYQTVTSTTKSSGVPTLALLSTTVDTVVGSSSGTQVTTSKTLTRNRIYKWKVRAWNCGQTAPYSTTSSLTIQ